MRIVIRYDISETLFLCDIPHSYICDFLAWEDILIGNDKYPHY